MFKKKPEPAEPKVYAVACVRVIDFDLPDGSQVSTRTTQVDTTASVQHVLDWYFDQEPKNGQIGDLILNPPAVIDGD